MKNLKILLFFVLITNICYSQNWNFKIFNDEIFPLLETNYWKAKELLLEIQKKNRVSYIDIAEFIEYSYKNNDIGFFKENLSNLIEYDGLMLKKPYIYYRFPFDQKMTSWYDSIFKIKHKIWVNNNIDKLQIINKISILYEKDQVYARLPNTNNDTSLLAKKIDDMFQTGYSSNFWELVSICKEINNFPNPFDFPSSTFSAAQLIVIHNIYDLDSVRFEAKWKMIEPYIEKSYFEGKISDIFFKIYDKNFYELVGYQYYGFIDGAPVKDPANFEERKRKYKL